MPGVLLAGRYRIVGLLGRGGMGEVYRAEDLKLGEHVALKFLPAQLTLDGAALARFHREVRLARNIAHRNVCRVFDIGEAGGLHFLSMEYIDGEDLSSLLKRIGRLPRNKAVELARQICAGLGAAHEAGVIHRDMKPANVMVDGEGRAKITDFGLAQVTDELQDQKEFAGTPAYMAPEQITAGEVSVKTDFYALGLVLYEMFTGERAFKDENWRRLVASGGHRDLSRPSSHLEGFDPVVEAVILRCLENEASDRPSSALEVSAALPGGDPLAAALAAGETPSPEMVAAAPRKGLLKPPVAFALLAATAFLVALGLWAGQNVTATALARLPKSPEVLEDRARTLLTDLGHTEEPVDSAWGWRMNVDYLRHLWREGSVEELARLKDGEPPLYWFWFRQSPEALRSEDWRPTLHSPAHVTPGMASVVLDPQGRLVKLRVVPPRRDEGRGKVDPDWSQLFAAAGLAETEFSPAEPQWTPAVHTHGRKAWKGLLHPGTASAGPVHVEAAHYRGVPVIFDVLAPWDQPLEVPTHRGHLLVAILMGVFFGGACTIGLWLVRRHLRDGRGDRRGANRLALFIVASYMLSWVLGAHHLAGAAEIGLFIDDTGDALVLAALVWILYLAFEPFLRRRWPDGIISWSRLLAGKLRDPLVGRDVLVGGLLGAAGMPLLAISLEIARRSGDVVLFADPNWPSFFEGFRITLAVFLRIHLADPLMMGLGGTFVFVLLLNLLRRRWLAAAVYYLAWAALLHNPMFQVPAFAFGIAALITLATARFGVLALVAFWFNFYLLVNMPTTTDLSSWHVGSTVFAVTATMGVAAWAYWTAVGGRPLFSRSPT